MKVSRRQRTSVIAFVVLLLVVGLDYWWFRAVLFAGAATAATAPTGVTRPTIDDVNAAALTGAPASIAVVARPIAKRDWKMYLSDKYRAVFEAKIRFDLVDLYTPRRLVDAGDDDATFHEKHAPRGFDALLQLWKEMRAEDAARKQQLAAFRAQRPDLSESSSESAARDASEDERPEWDGAEEWESLSKEQRRAWRRAAKARFASTT